MGVEADVELFGGGGLLVPIFQFVKGPLPPESPGDNFAIALFDETAFTLIIPLVALGGDDSFNFALNAGSFFEPTDCAPNGGFITSGATPGDCTGDGGDPNIVDVLRLLRHIGDPAVPLSCGGGDCTGGGGDANIVDVLRLLRRIGDPVVPLSC